MIRASNNLVMMVVPIAIIVIYFIARSMAKSSTNVLDTTAHQVTKPVGNFVSDYTSWLNGYTPVELTPIVIDDHHLNWDYTLTSEAERVYWKVPEYQSVLYKLFGAKGQPMKTKYRHLIGKSITEDTL